MTRIIAAMALLAMAGCGREGSFGPNQSPGGIYLGEITPSGASAPDTLVGLVDESGYGYFIDTDASVIYGIQTNADGNRLAANVRIYQPSSTGLPGTLSGTIIERTSVTGFATSTLGNSTFTASYQADLYGMPSAYLLIAGDYQLSGAFSNARIAADGAVTGSDGGNCVFNGQVTIPDSRFNAYRLNGTNSCAGLPDQAFNGIFSYVPQVGATPPALNLIYSDGVDTAYAAVAQKL